MIRGSRGDVTTDDGSLIRRGLEMLYKGRRRRSGGGRPQPARAQGRA
jgi:hypothetical protein